MTTTSTPTVTSVRVVRDRVVHLTFADGLAADIDLAPYLWGPMFEPLAQDDHAFATAHVDGETVVWDNGADLAPETLYDTARLAHGLPPLFWNDEPLPVQP